MKILSAISQGSESTSGIGVEGVKMNLANPQQATSNGFLHTVLLALVLSIVFSTVAQADGFRSVKGGMQVKDMQTGTGPVASEGMVATIQFTGWLDNQGVRGKELYNSRNSGQPVSFVIGTDKVMSAWNEGVLGMRAGGRRMLLVPPGMAYGKRAIDDVIPADSSLQFIIELVRLEE
jgi:FKBP-type peptidyl-prolyl cis-trans isomerase